MRARRHTYRAFTLIEILMVMALIAVIAAMVAPSMKGFIAGRESSNAGTLILSLTSYARTQAAAEGLAYRMNFDPNAHTVWLTRDNGGGQFQDILSSDYGKHFQVSSTIRVDVTVNPQANFNLMLPPNTEQQQLQQTGQSINGQQLGGATTLMQNVHVNGVGTYIEFQPTGRADPSTIKLTDNAKKVVTIECASATDVFHILPSGVTR